MRAFPTSRFDSRHSALRAFPSAAFLWTLPWLLIAAPVAAGDYHDGPTLDCAECHVMHPGASSSAGTEQSEGAGKGAISAGIVDRKLLKRDVNDLCLSCHDGSTRAVDVLGINQGRRAGDVRQAGHLNRMGRDGSPGTGHTLDSLDVAPGSDPPWRAEKENGPGKGLACINCHAHHGSEEETPTYRNLRSDAGNNHPGEGLVTYNHERIGSNDLSRDVFVRRARSYDESAVDFNEPRPRDSAIGRFCAGCHDEFHGVPGVDETIGGTLRGRSLSGFLRHPTGGVNLSDEGGQRSNYLRFASRQNRVKVMSESGLWDPPGSDVSPTCITCHKAHGNRNAFGLIYRSGSGELTEEGDTGGGAVEDLCLQCHGDSSLLAAP